MSKYIDIHILQTLPPNCINRDGDNKPKTCWYGGVTRMRVSSQAWKHATREWFRQHLDSSQLGSRSKQFAHMLASRMTVKLNDDQLNDIAATIMKTLGIPFDKQNPGKASALQFFGNQQWDKIAEIADLAANSDDPAKVIADHKKELRQQLDADRSLDVAMFGRMTASSDKDGIASIDAAIQVAHAFSVNRATPEVDFLTAVDDSPIKGDPSSGHVGDPQFTSGTVYRYANINLDLLGRNLGDKNAVETAVKAFLQAFIESMPTGKQNSFAARTLPALVVTEVHDLPFSLADAFAQPINTGDILGEAASRLVSTEIEYSTIYGIGSARRHIIALGDVKNQLPDEWREQVGTLRQLVDDTTADALKD